MQDERLELLACRAADAKRAALRHLFAALAAGSPPALQSFLRDHPGPFSRPGWVDEFLQDPDRFELDALDRNWRPLLRELVARLAEGMPHEAGGSSGSCDLVEELTAWANELLSQPAASRDASSSQVVRFLESARQDEIAARNAVSELVQHCYSLPEQDNPILWSARKVVVGYRGTLLEPDDLASTCIERLYNRIDQFRDARDAGFQRWIWQLIKNNAATFYRQRHQRKKHHKQLYNARAENPDPPDFVANTTLQNEQAELLRTPFSVSDWAVISQWAVRNTKVPIVVMVGWNWWRKVAADADHWERFSEWCRESGVDDVERLKDDLAALEDPTTCALLQCLAARQSVAYNTTARLFHRPFSGISQSSRQTSFGKWHLVVELEFFWQLMFSGVVSQHDSQQVCDELKQYDLHPRIAALLCAPAWPLVGSVNYWRNVSGDYPFLESPPLLEFLYRQYNLTDRDRNALPPGLEEGEAVWAYCRQVMLAHATRGRFDEVKRQVATARRQGTSKSGCKTCGGRSIRRKKRRVTIVAEVLYTWRRLRHPLTGSDSLAICWDRAGARHFIEDRAHFQEAESLWRCVVPAEVIDPVLQLSELAPREADAALQRFAGWLDKPLRSVYAAPRVLVIESIPKGAAHGRTTMIVIPQFGACFVSKKIELNHYEWRTMYFPRSLVNGLALFPEAFEQTTLREIVETYSAAGTVLPDPDNPGHSVKRRHEVDSAIRFIEPRVWGFESDQPGARWLGMPQVSNKEVT